MVLCKSGSNSVQVQSPFPVEQLPLAWEWIHEFPLANLDDYAPQTLDAFTRDMQERFTYERSWAVLKHENYCGMVAYRPVTNRLGWLHGICFAKGHCTSEEKRAVVTNILNELFGQGIDKICATFFADNRKIEKFLCDLGAVREGVLVNQTVRQGLLLDMVQVALFSPKA